MDRKNTIINKIQDFNLASDKDIEVSFVYKTRRKDDKYFFFQAPLSDNGIKDEISTILSDGFISLLNQCELKEFDPLYIYENTIEYMDLSEINNFNDFMTSYQNNTSDNIKAIEVPKISFYYCCINNTETDEKIHFFKNYRNPKILRDSYPLKLIDSTLRKIEEPMFYLDAISDLLIIDNVVYICNRNTLNTVFDYKDEFLKNLDTALEKIRYHEILNNFEQFQEDCKQNILIAKKFTRILRKREENFHIVLDNFDQVPSKLEELNLDIRFDDQNRIIYSGKEDLNDIATIFSDGFAKTLICERKIRAGDEEEIS